MCPRWWRVLTDIHQVQQSQGSRLLVCALPCICQACAILLAVCVCQCKVLKGSHEFLLWLVCGMSSFCFALLLQFRLMLFLLPYRQECSASKCCVKNLNSQQRYTLCEPEIFMLQFLLFISCLYASFDSA